MREKKKVHTHTTMGELYQSSGSVQLRLFLGQQTAQRAGTSREKKRGTCAIFLPSHRPYQHSKQLRNVPSL